MGLEICALCVSEVALLMIFNMMLPELKRGNVPEHPRTIMH